MSAGTLFVVATPIGNLEDITLRALRVLREVAMIACEDTRVTRRLLEAHDIATPTTAFHAHSAPEVVERLVGRLLDGDSIALVSDAGTPIISDPGDALVSAAIAAGVSVSPIPGPSALLAALSASGLPAHHTLFLGFLPRGDAERREILAPLRDAPYTLVIYESPGRLHATLLDLQHILGDRSACVAREVTKHFETFVRGALSALAAEFEAPTRGEVAIVIAPSGPGSPATNIERARAEARRLLDAGARTADVAKVIAGAHGLSKQEAYHLVLAEKTGGPKDQ